MVYCCCNLPYTVLYTLHHAGNYNCLAPLGHLGLFATPREYYLELGRHILLFYDTVDFFNEDLISLAIHVCAVYVLCTFTFTVNLLCDVYTNVICL